MGVKGRSRPETFSEKAFEWAVIAAGVMMGLACVLGAVNLTITLFRHG